jgi:hypothetical protein
VSENVWEKPNNIIFSAERSCLQQVSEIIRKRVGKKRDERGEKEEK